MYMRWLFLFLVYYLRTPEHPSRYVQWYMTMCIRVPIDRAQWVRGRLMIYGLLLTTWYGM